MTTKRYLWLGFGTLILLLLATCLLIVSRVATIDGEVREMADARNFSAATAQLESDALRYVMAIRDHLQTGSPAYLQIAETASSAVQQHLRDYRRLAASDRRYDLAGEFEPLWRELYEHGQALAVVGADAVSMAEHSNRFMDARQHLQQMLASDMQTKALALYNRRKDEALQDTRTVIRFVVFLLFGGTLLALATSVAISRGVVGAERHLASGRELLRVTLGSIADAVVTTDRHRVVTYLNPAAESLTGWSLQEALGQPLSQVLNLVEEASRSPVESSAATLLQGGRMIDAQISTILLSRTNAEHAVEERAAAILDEGGVTVGAVMIVRDVTERRRLERELRSQAGALAESDRRKTEFLSMLSHELRNPLAPVSNALQILRQRIDQAPALQPIVAMMERQVTQMVRLVDDLVDIGRISRGKIELRMATTELVAALQLAVESIRPLLDSHEHDLHVQLPTHPVNVHADPARLAQIVGNLLSNAAKFTPPGGRIDLRVQIEGPDVLIRVIDSGIGISPQHLPYVFDLYMQVDSSLGRSGSGIGIGLALVKLLVDLHGGSVSVHSAGVGRGSEFIVRLPLLSVASPLSAVPPATTRSDSTSPRVLLVDDNRDALASMALLLEAAGHCVSTAADGDEALVLAERERPDAVLLDLGMPRMDGFAVARALRASAWGQAIAVIAMTGFGQQQDHSQTAEAGFDAHLVKPATIAQVREALSSTIERRAARRLQGVEPSVRA